MNPLLEDLEVLLQAIADIHPDPYHENSRKHWDEVITDVRSRLSQKDDAEAITEYYRIVALLADSHSRINLQFGNLHQMMESSLPSNLIYPFRSYVFADGCYITATENRDLLGKKLKAIGGTDIVEIAKLLRPFMPVENDSGFIGYLPFFLNNSLFLKRIGIIEALDSSMPLEFDDGTTVDMIPGGTDLVRLEDQLELPHYWRTETPLSIRKEDNLLVVDIRTIANSEILSFRDLARKLDQSLQLYKDDDDLRLVFDIRQNGGGDNHLNQYLVLTVIRNDWINVPGRVFCLIDRWTFSAAINLANDLERYTWTLFAGEPFCGKVNHYGDSKATLLPNSKLEVKISSLYWQDSDPNDFRKTIIPDLPVDLSYVQYVSGEDPVMEEVRNYERGEDWQEYYDLYSPRYKRYRESQQESIRTYFSHNES